MTLTISDQYRLAADEHGWSIQRPRPRKRNGETVSEWESFKWYGSIQQAVNALGELMVRTSDAQDLATALKVVENVSAKLSRALSVNFSVVRKDAA